jgi:hypothetical protein
VRASTSQEKIVIHDMMKKAATADDTGYVAAHRLLGKATVEAEYLEKLLQASKLRMDAAFFCVTEAARIYVETLEDEISVAPACKCECKGS